MMQTQRSGYVTALASQSSAIAATEEPAHLPSAQRQPGFLPLRLWPLPACALLAATLLWLQPARDVSALVAVLAYLGLCLLPLRRHWRAHRQPHLGTGNLLIAYASQGGMAQQLAERSAVQLRDAGLAPYTLPLNELTGAMLQTSRQILFVVSTYGEGEAPDNAARFQRHLQDKKLDLSHLHYAMLALGDRDYRYFCGFARQLDRHLRRLHATPLFDRLEVDRGDPGCLRHWQQQLGHLSGSGDFIDWQPASYQRWRLSQRECLNPGSPGAPVFHLALNAIDTTAQWQAGDIAEVGPRHAPATVEALLQRLGHDPGQPLEDGQSLAMALATRRLPTDEATLHGLEASALLQQLPALPHREYSIASIPTDGQLELLVRQMHHPDGRLGLGSGWLCRHAEINAEIALRIRQNPSFHGPDGGTPLILIGNGTGLAGLRAHLRERQGTPGSRNWLLFGERSAAHDSFFHKELQGWRHSGHLQRLDLAFSRDQAERVYVQHLLRDAADELHDWIAEGAALYLCGSLEGMGRGVEQTLADLLGESRLEALAEQGRYRRDLY